MQKHGFAVHVRKVSQICRVSNLTPIFFQEYCCGIVIQYSDCIHIYIYVYIHNVCINSLAPGRSGFKFKSAIFNLVLLIGIFRSSYDNALRWMSWDLPEDKSTLVQVMAWCRQATSHYLSQCWPRSVSPYGVTRAQWVNPYVCTNITFYKCTGWFVLIPRPSIIDIVYLGLSYR